MTRSLPGAALLDTSVLLRFFHDEHDVEQEVADAVLDAWLRDRMQLALLDLSIYELVNASVRKLGHPPDRVRASIDNVFRLQMPMVGVDATLGGDAAELAATLGLTGYDAAFLAAARRLGLPLLTGDQQIAGVAADAISLRSLAASSHQRRANA